MPLTPTQLRVATWTLIAGGAAWLLWWLGPVLTPFIVAATLAYALAPLVDRLVARLHFARVLAVVVVEVALVALVLALGLLVVPILAKQLPLLREQLPLLLDRLNAGVQPLLAQLGIDAQLDLASLKVFVREHLSTNFEDSLGPVMASVKLGGSVALSVLGNALLIPVVLFYLLLDWAAVVRLLLSLVPPRLRQGVDSFLAEADAVLGQYLRGQLLVMAVLALYYVVGLTLFGLKLALPIGVFTGLAIAIPYLGFGLGLVLALLAGSLEFAAAGGVAQALLMVGVVYGIGQVAESFYLTPKLVGERIGLHPLAVIFALLAFGHALGFIGVLIALPSSAVLLVALRRATRSYKASRLYGG
ncbi:MAG: AI-2E family transporter [Rhodoferax sp.]|nr:AI-2E family transporter [Rhodoferax sp.]